tara:strand:- start:1158 stop:1640 length:483 start_codon:yes stop_codon:yes gene_type:complete
MPCEKCENGKYKWGKTGSCKYDTKADCEKSNKKKYNKMKPTPLGKKSYEEYEKELKEFNLSSEVKKIELGVVDNLIKLNKQMSSILNKVDTVGKKWDKLDDEINDLGKNARNLVNKLLGTQQDLSDSLKNLGLNENDVPALKESEKVVDDFFIFSKRYNF